jgi:hypothetical protein
VNLKPRFIGFFSKNGSNKTSVFAKTFEKVDISADNNVSSAGNI